jgi:ABC-type amino acid transport substrate-binding protein
MTFGTCIRFKAPHRAWWAWCLAAVATASLAGEPLRYGVFESMSYPMVIHDGSNAVRGGLIVELGAALARELGTDLQTQPLPRKRIDAAVQSGEVDLVCYWSPEWTEQADKVLWTIKSLPQVERIVTRPGGMPPAVALKYLEGKTIAAQLGFHYPSLQPWFDSGKVKRKDETRVETMFRSLELGVSDVLVTSEAEIQGYFKNFPQTQAQFEVSPFVFSKVSTQCGLSPKSHFTLMT